MRIDTCRNQIDATRKLLDQVDAELEDLYALAYDRQAAADEAKVSGGGRDYALDTHGDPRIRDAYRQFSSQIDRACSDMAEAAHNTLRWLASTAPVKAGPRTTTAVEHALLLEAKARRAQRGEYEPVMRVAQPQIADDLLALTNDKTKLERQVNRLVKALSDATGDSPGSIRESLLGEGGKAA